MHYVYILSSIRRTLYTGVTSNLLLRVDQHRRGVIPGFTSRYKVTQLVYVEPSERAIDAFEREKQIKRWRREKKLELILRFNPELRDLWTDLVGPEANAQVPAASDSSAPSRLRRDSARNEVISRQGSKADFGDAGGG
jgi:putative endonuclease